MKKFVNLNNYWVEKFAEVMQAYDIKHVCISPGSRSTPLTASFATNKFFRKHVIIDERSSGFFALGIAKALQKPVILITTSGTAVAELYPAVIEAYQQRIPLIVCTADRPEYLIERGANQTINQNNIYQNHIRFFADLGLPSSKINSIKKLQKTAEIALNVCTRENRGPVHLNFPFEKPLEPSSANIEVENESNKFVKSQFTTKINSQKKVKFDSNKILFLVGWDNYHNNFAKKLIQISEKYSIPIVADGASQFRFNKLDKNVISNASAFLHSQKVKEILEPDIIIQFGNAPTSNTVLDFYKNSKAKKILVNEFGDWKDPSNTADELLKYNYTEFLESFNLKINTDKNYFEHWINSDKKCDRFKTNFIKDQSLLFEGKVITELLNVIPSKSNLMISNSLPIRDFDLFSGIVKKEINVFANRGASGIDGIISTSLGISICSNNSTYLLIGDLAFLHDTNGLLTALNYKLPLNIILINNGGGKIFEMLPVFNEKKIFEKFFKTPQKVKFSNIAKAYDAYYKEINEWKRFSSELEKTTKSRRLRILELNTSAVNSSKIRKEFKTLAAEETEKLFD